MEKIPMTAAGHATLEAELKHCQAVERPRIIQQITEARTHGDLSENAEYHAAKEQQSLNEGRIAELEDKLARADRQDQRRDRRGEHARRRQGLRDQEGRVEVKFTVTPHA